MEVKLCAAGGYVIYLTGEELQALYWMATVARGEYPDDRAVTEPGRRFIKAVEDIATPIGLERL